MNRTDLPQATSLYQRAVEIEEALGVIDRAGTITAVTITPKEATGEGVGERIVSTIGLQYPPQMIEAIRTQLEERLAAINHELADLGVSEGVAR